MLYFFPLYLKWENIFDTLPNKKNVIYFKDCNFTFTALENESKHKGHAQYVKWLKFTNATEVKFQLRMPGVFTSFNYQMPGFLYKRIQKEKSLKIPKG